MIWVRRARQEFDTFVDPMREYGVEVLPGAGGRGASGARAGRRDNAG